MPGLAEIQKPPIQDQIVELTKKIQLLEGDRKAYYESSQWAIKKNRDTILKLRQENKKLHKTLADVLAGDDKVIDEAFIGRDVERAALRNKTGKMAMSVVDHKVCDSRKRLNALKSATESYKRRVSEYKTQCDQLLKDMSAVEEMRKGESEYAQHIRQLENRLDKARLKGREAQHISRVYENIKGHLQQESLTFHNRLDQQEAELLRERQELLEVQSFYTDAQVARDNAKEELAHHEDRVYKDRKKRELALGQLKAKAEEKKAHAERVERKLMRVQMQGQEMEQESNKPRLTEEEQERKITSYEEAFLRIKEATCVSGTEGVVARFRSQGDTQIHLADLKQENLLLLEGLQEERAKLQQEYDEMMYSGEAKSSSNQRVLQELEKQIYEQEWLVADAAERLDEANHLLVSLKAGVEHLADKLQHLKLAATYELISHSSADGYVLDLLSISEGKLIKLMEDLDGKDLFEILREMEEEEFHSSIENKLPSYNARVSVPSFLRQDNFQEDDEESGDEDAIAPSRAELKRQSQQIIDAKVKKTRNRPRKKKMGKF